MSSKSAQENDEENAILLLEDQDENSHRNEHNIHNDIDDEMLLLSSSPSSDEANSFVPEAGPSGVNANISHTIEINSSNIVIEDSDSEELESSANDNSIEVIGSDEEEDELGESDSCESNSSFLDGKVQIFMAQGSFFIWNAEDVQILREECRIVGKLVGCLPRAPRQNNQLGLPLQLMPEEAKLLEDIEAACVVEELEASDDIGQLRKTAFDAYREENYKAQQKMYKESRKEEVRQHKQEIIEGKKAKKRKLQLADNGEEVLPVKRAKASEAKSSTSERETDEGSKEDLTSDASKNDVDEKLEAADSDITSESKDDLENISKTDGVSGKAEKSFSESVTNVDNTSLASEQEDEKKSEDGAAVSKDEDSKVDGDNTQECGASGDEKNIEKDETVKKKDDCVVISIDQDNNEEEEDEEFNVDDIVTAETHVKHSLVQLFTENPWAESVKRSKQWIFPLSQKEYLRYEVFKDLWRKGYFLTSGSKFGGDFLVYPGDPARFHSHFIAVCIDKTVDLSALDIISLGRLGSNVRKTVLLCAFNKLRQITYTSLQWTGVS